MLFNVGDVVVIKNIEPKWILEEHFGEIGIITQMHCDNSFLVATTEKDFKESSGWWVFSKDIILLGDL